MERRTHMKLSTRLIVLLCLMGAGLIVASAAMIILPYLGQGMLTMLTVQDIAAFIIPALAAMALFYRRPWHAMCMHRAPSWTAVLVVLAVLGIPIVAVVLGALTLTGFAVPLAVALVLGFGPDSFIFYLFLYFNAYLVPMHFSGVFATAIPVLRLIRPI